MIMAVSKQKRAEIRKRHTNGECAADIASAVKLKIITVVRVIRELKHKRKRGWRRPKVKGTSRPKRPHMPSEAEIRAETQKIRERGHYDHEGIWHPPWDPETKKKRQAEPTFPATFPTYTAALFHAVARLRSAELREQEDELLAHLIAKGLTRHD